MEFCEAVNLKKGVGVTVLLQRGEIESWGQLLDIESHVIRSAAGIARIVVIKVHTHRFQRRSARLGKRSATSQTDVRYVEGCNIESVLSQEDSVATAARCKNECAAGPQPAQIIHKEGGRFVGDILSARVFRVPLFGV